MVTFLVLAFAQPTIKEDQQSLEVAERVVIYLDNAPAMRNVQEGESRINEAVKYAQAIVNAYPEGTRFHFIENSYKNSLLTNYSKQSLADLLAETGVVAVGRSLDEVLNRIQSLNLKGDIYLISDFQKSSNSVQFDTLNQYHLAPIKNDLRANLYIDSVYLENSFLSGDFSNQLKISVGANDKEIRNTNIRVFFGEQLSGTVAIEVDGYGQGVFELSEGQERIEQVRLELDDPAVTFDNDFYLSINALQQTRVIEVYESNSTRFINELFTGNEYFSFDRTSATNLNTGLIESADMLIINGVNQYSNQLKNAINTVLEKGANVTIIPGNDLVFRDLLSLGARMISDDRQEVVLETPDFENPFFDGVFEAQEAQMQMPYATTNYRLLNPEYDLLKFLNGRPFLSKVASPNNLFVFTSPFEEQYTSFVNHALFVPVLYRLALGSQRNFARLYYYTDSEVVSFPINEGGGAQVFNLESATTTITPDQRLASGQLVMSFPKDELLPGIYQVKGNDELKGYISFNQSQAESKANPDVDTYLEDLAVPRNVQYFEAENASVFNTLLQNSLIGTSLWKYALMLGLLFLFVEIILIRYL